MAVWRNTVYKELIEGSPVRSVAMDMGKATRRYLVSTDAQVAYFDFLGYASIAFFVGKGFGPPYLSRSIPHPMPRQANYFAVNVAESKGVGFPGDAQGYNGLDGMARYKYERMTIQYGVPSYFILDDLTLKNQLSLDYPHEGKALASGWINSRYITKLRKPTTKILSFNRGAMRIVDGSAKGLAVKEGLPLRVPKEELIYTWHQVPLAVVPFAAQIALSNTINNAVFDGYPAGTMLYDGADVKPYPSGLTIAGIPTFFFDVQYKFSVLLNVGYGRNDMPPYAPFNGAAAPTAWGWNYYLRNFSAAKPGGGTAADLRFMLITSDGTVTGRRSFLTGDFTQLFAPDGG